MNEKKKVASLAFMNLEKANDRMERQAMWQVLKNQGVEVRALFGMKDFFAQSRACVRICGNVSVCCKVMATPETRVLDVSIAVHYLLDRANDRRDSQKYAGARFQHDQPKSERVAS